MPYKDPKDRNHKREYELFLENGGREKQSERQRARRAWDKEHGYESRKGKSLHHIKPIKNGGKSTPQNIKLVDFSKNSSNNYKKPKAR